jgi:integrase/recombinase XerD
MNTNRKKPEISTSILLIKWVKNKEGKHPVKLRVTYQRNRKYYTLKKEHYSSEDFEAIYDPKTRGKLKEKRKKFDKVEDRAIDIIDNVLDEFSFDAFEIKYLNHKTKIDTSVKAFFNNKITEIDEEKIQTATLYRSTLRSLLEFDEKITFQKITPQYLKKYQKWMLEKGNSYTTIGMYLRNLKCIINIALKNGIRINYPFGKEKEGKYSILKSKNFKKALNLSEINAMFEYKTETRNEFVSLQYWLFSYLCNGMNMVDIANLKYKNIQGNNILFIRQKTKDISNEITEISVFILPEVLEIIKNIGNENKKPENYIFPIFKQDLTVIEKNNILKQHIKYVNKYIRRVAGKIGINENITTYWARHSYSTILKRAGTPIEFISEQLGHQDTKTTKSYLDGFEDEQREKYSKKLIGK